MQSRVVRYVRAYEQEGGVGVRVSTLVHRDVMQ